MKIVKIGFPAAIQLAITSFSNVFVQSYISFYGTDFMSGWSAYSKLDQFLFLPMQSLSLAVTTFVGQNLGAGKIKRARKGANVALLMSLVTTMALMIPMLAFPSGLVRLFNKEAMPIHYGSVLLRLMSPFYLFCCVNQTYSGALRGAGKTTAPMIIMLSNFVAFRQLYLAVTFPYENYILTSLAYPAGWVLCATTMFIYYSLSKWRVNVVSDNVSIDAVDALDEKEEEELDPDFIN